MTKFATLTANLTGGTKFPLLNSPPDCLTPPASGGVGYETSYVFKRNSNVDDKSVHLSEKANKYPFAGYKAVLNDIYNIVHTRENGVILDIGFGTGVLTQKLYDDGYTVFGIDFSNKMIEIARTKMPEAILIQHDFSTGLPKELSNAKFDFIISTYALHHLKNDDKVIVIKQLLKHLNPNGKMLIGDVAFDTESEFEFCKNSNKEDWDDDEIYIVLDDLKKHFPNALFDKVSHCAGIISFVK